MPTYHNHIDGAWVPSDSGEMCENRNPADADDLIGLFPRSTRRDVERALDAAQRAYARWRLVPAPRRAEILFRAAALLAERKEEFARDMTREMGKVLAETRGDVQEAIDMTFFMAGEGRRQYGQTVPSELRDKFAMSVRQPLGVCAVVTPWNFPMAIPSWKIAPALVCGNTVVRGCIGATLFDLGIYPAAIPAHDSHVWGEVHQMVDPDTVLRALDEIEGYSADEPDASLYTRAEIPVLLEDGRGVRAWAYFYNAPLGRAQRIESGDYLEHLKVR